MQQSLLVITYTSETSLAKVTTYTHLLFCGSHKLDNNHHHHHDHVAGEGRCVAPAPNNAPWLNPIFIYIWQLCIWHASRVPLVSCTRIIFVNLYRIRVPERPTSVTGWRGCCVTLDSTAGLLNGFVLVFPYIFCSVRALDQTDFCRFWSHANETSLIDWFDLYIQVDEQRCACSSN